MAGIAIALLLIFSTQANIEATPTMLVLGGAIAISAMILPGISGAFMLLLLGLYPVVVNAVHDRDVFIVLWVALGCLIGILSFSQLLQWLLKQWHDRVMSFMLGFVVGALVKVWPWQIEENHQWFLPNQYTAATGLDNYLWFSIIAFIFGSLLVLLLTVRSQN
jgi:putative membrane protein